MRMRRAAAITSVVMLASSLSVVLAPAQAVTTVSITAPNITVRLNACGRSTVTVTGDWAGDTYNSVEAFVTGPGGNTFAGGYWDNERTGSIAVPVRLCGSENYPGRYTVAVKALGFGEGGENPTEVNATKTFQFTKVDPRARSAITKKVRYTRGAYKWKVPGRLFRAGRGYVGRRVAVQAMIQGDWTHMQGQKTRRKGRFGWKFKPNGFTWRYVFYGNATTRPSVSVAFRTPRPAGRQAAAVDPRSVVS